VSTTTEVVRVTVNGEQHERETEVRTVLSDFLRHKLGYTGTHVGCEHGVCGACTVLLDGRAVRSCLMLAVQADGHEVTTVEALAGDDGSLSPLQQSFFEHHGLQCGFCTPGILMGVMGAAAAGSTLEETLESVLPGHLCRCTGYVNIREAIRKAWPEVTAR
jgi:aerobic-type carbon monoxide dehydrogenase small subunit (CoxS/CutS family)